MSDVAQAALWAAILVGGLGVCVLLRRAGVPSTYVRDVLHVGAGGWVLGWPWWHRPVVPIAITTTALVAIAMLPLLARRSTALAAVQRSVTGDDERWSGILLYTLSFAALTAVGLLTHAPFPAAAALLALALGDGVGGAIGRRFGRHRFTVGSAKAKSIEGTVAVALAAGVGIAVASAWFHAPLSPALLIAAAALAAAAEAIAPRASDNVLLPATVWLLLVAAR